MTFLRVVNVNRRFQFFSTRRRDYDYYDQDRRYDYYNDRDGYDDYYHEDRDRYSRRESQDYREEPRKKRKGSGAGGVLSIIIRVLFLFFVVVVLLLPQVLPGPPEPFDKFKPISDRIFDYIIAGMYKYQETPDTVDFTVERAFTIESNGELEYTLLMPIPQNLEIDGQPAQELLSTQFSTPYTRISAEDNKWVWEGSMPNGGKNQISIVYHFKTAKIRWDISITKSGTISDIPAKFTDRYLGNQWPVKNFNDVANADLDNDGVPDIDDVDDNNDGIIDKYRIEPGNAQIRSLLIDILNEANIYSGTNLNDIGHLNVYKVVKAIYDRIDDNCLYPTQEQQYQDSQIYGSYPKWATGTWNDKRGDCDDQSILFISLCRAAGIPAMLEIGALYDPTFVHWEGHGWANVIIPYSDIYAEEKGDAIITPMVDIVNNIFLFRDPNRFSEWVDDGVRGYINQDGEWEYSNIEKRYLAWEYTRGDQSVDVDIGEEYMTIEFKAYPPEKKLYL